MASDNQKIYKILRKLVERGWTPLHTIAALTGKKGPAIYARQHTKNKITTVKVGGTNRVYEDEFVRVMQNEPDQINAQVILDLYERMRKLKDE